MRLLSLFASTLVLFLGLGAGASNAALLSERSSVRLGLWWDPVYTGSGFEVIRGGEQIAVIWYTYRPDGTPIWYTAAGRFDQDGTWDAPLLQHRWVNGARGPATEVGRLQLERRHFESLTLQWSLDGKQGTQNLQPFPLSGILPEVDHTGAWYDPSRSGFGISLVEQGEHKGAGLYFYDAAGEPTWRIGQNGGRGDEFVLHGYTGRCPGCEPRQTRITDEGSLRLNFESETSLIAKYTGAASAPWMLDGRLVQLSTPASLRPADRQLAGFDDAPSLRRYLDEALLVPPTRYATVDFSAPPAAEATSTYSTTNVQEAGVDEADRLKTDGNFLYTFDKNAQGQDLPELRVAEARDDGRNLVMHRYVSLAPESRPFSGYSGLYVTADRLVALRGTPTYAYAFASIWNDPYLWMDGGTQVSVLRRGNPAAPTLEHALEFDAHLVASRRIGERVYLVLRKAIALPTDFEYGSDADPARDARNRDRISQIAFETMLPRVRVNGGEWQPVLDARDVTLPIAGTVRPSAEFVTVVAIDLRTPTQLQAMAVAGSVSAVYVSRDTMYLATSRAEWRVDPMTGRVPGGYQITDIHKIALDQAKPRFVATGAVEGMLDRDADRAPFRFSEKDGRLRVVTVGGEWGSLGQNRLTVLEPSSLAPGLLRTLSYLPNRDRPAPLGKPDEQLYGTRFVGDRLYAVTFLKIDPLYVVDISNPAAPLIAGQVELPGFSDYLHPVGESVLLGIGLDARPAQSSWGDGQFAWFQGLQFSLFDVSDPSRPRVLQQSILGKRGSGTTALQTHHALSVLPGSGGTSFAMPVRVHEADGSEPPLPPDNYYYPWSWSGLQTLDVIGNSPSTARLVPGPALVTHRRSSTPEPINDDTWHGARSVLFAQGMVYVENGRFWRMDRNGANVSGPY